MMKISDLQVPWHRVDTDVQWAIAEKKPHLNSAKLIKLPPLPDFVPFELLDFPEGTLPLGVTDVDSEVRASNGAPVLLWRYTRGGTPHMIIVGATDAGKSSLMRTLIVNALKAGNAALVDGKRAGDYEWARDVLDVFEDENANTCAGAVRGIREMVEQRYNRSREAKRHKEIYRPTPYFFFLDEYVGLGEDLVDNKNNKAKSDYWRDLGQLLRLARGAKVYLVLATQRPDISGGLSGEARDNAQMRCAVGPLTPDASRMVFGDGNGSVGASTLPVKGRSVAGVLGGQFDRLQSFWLPDPYGDEASPEDRQLVSNVLTEVTGHSVSL